MTERELEIFLFPNFFLIQAYILLSKFALINKLKFFWFFSLNLDRLILTLIILAVYLQMQRTEID